jgi:hypothetical protein
MISPEFLLAMTKEERNLYVILVAMWNKNRWNPLQINLKKDICIKYDMRYDYTVASLKSLQTKNFLIFEVNGPKIDTKHTIAYVLPESTKIKPEDGLIKPEDGLIKPEDGLIKPETGKGESPVITTPTTESLPNTLDNTFNIPLIKNNKQTLDTFKATNTTGEESIAKASMPLLTAKAVELNSIDDLNLDIQEVVPSKATQDISLESILDSESLFEVKTNASSREHIKTDIQDIQQAITGYAKTINIDGIANLDVDITYKEVMNGKVNNEIKTRQFYIPAFKLNGLTPDNAANLIDNWKHEVRPHYFNNDKLLIDKVKIKFIDNQQELYKWY